MRIAGGIRDLGCTGSHPWVSRSGGPLPLWRPHCWCSSKGIPPPLLELGTQRSVSVTPYPLSSISWGETRRFGRSRRYECRGLLRRSLTAQTRRRRAERRAEFDHQFPSDMAPILRHILSARFGGCRSTCLTRTAPRPSARTRTERHDRLILPHSPSLHGSQRHATSP